MPIKKHNRATTQRIQATRKHVPQTHAKTTTTNQRNPTNLQTPNKHHPLDSTQTHQHHLNQLAVPPGKQMNPISQKNLTHPTRDTTIHYLNTTLTKLGCTKPLEFLLYHNAPTMWQKNWIENVRAGHAYLRLPLFHIDLHFKTIDIHLDFTTVDIDLTTDKTTTNTLKRLITTQIINYLILAQTALFDPPPKPNHHHNTWLYKQLQKSNISVQYRPIKSIIE